MSAAGNTRRRDRRAPRCGNRRWRSGLQVQPGEPFPAALVKMWSPAARIRSATSSGGRAIYFAASESASRGLAVAPIWRFERWM